MKIAIQSLAVCLTSLLALSQAQACLGEAQIVAKVVATEALPKTQKFAAGCRVFIAQKDVSFFAVNQLCLLGMGQIVEQGIVFDLTQDGQCPLQAGETVGGILSLGQDGRIRILTE